MYSKSLCVPVLISMLIAMPGVSSASRSPARRWSSLGRMFAGRADGFTLLELLVVLLIVGLVVSLAPTGFHRVLPSLELEAAARSLAANLRGLRSTAIHRSSSVSVSVDAEDKEGSLMGSPVLLPVPEGASLPIKKWTPLGVYQPASSFTFNADGSTSGAVLELSRHGTAYRVHVDWLTGRVEIVR